MENKLPKRKELEDMVDSLNLSRNFSLYFDHTNLKEDAKNNDIKKLCKEAVMYKTKTICIRPDKVKYAYDILNSYRGSMKKDGSQKYSHIPDICTVVDFPEGNGRTDKKAIEAFKAMSNGAKELDMVLNREWLKAKKYSLVENDIKAVVDVAKKYNGIVKVIFENCRLTKGEIVKACKLAEAAKADYVKTSTGFKEYGAREEDVALMHNTVPNLNVKAAGGIRTAEEALCMIYAGANRIGASKSVEMIKEFRQSYSREGSYELHEAMKRQIKASPGIIGLEKIVLAGEEVSILGKKVVDLEFRDKSGRNYIVEIKSGELSDSLLEKYRAKVKNYRQLYVKACGKDCEAFLVYRRRGRIVYEKI